MKGEALGPAWLLSANVVLMPSRARMNPSTQKALPTAQNVDQQISVISFPSLQAPNHCIHDQLGILSHAWSTSRLHKMSIFVKTHREGSCSANRVFVLDMSSGRIDESMRLNNTWRIKLYLPPELCVLEFRKFTKSRRFRTGVRDGRMIFCIRCSTNATISRPSM